MRQDHELLAGHSPRFFACFFIFYLIKMSSSSRSKVAHSITLPSPGLTPGMMLLFQTPVVIIKNEQGQTC